MWRFLKSFVGKLFGVGGTAAGSSSALGTLADAGTMRVLAGKEGYQSWLNAQTGAGLTGAQREANAFTAEQAQINRDWQTEMSNTAYQRQVADMRAAGVNPALAMQSASGATTPSGSAGSSVSPGAGASMSDIMQMMLLGKQRKLMDAQIANVEANTNKQNTEAGLTQKQLDVFDVMTDAQLRDIESLIGQRDASAALSRQGISESKAREALTIMQKALAGIDKEYRAKLNDAQLKYQQALTAFYNQKSKESEQQVKLMAAQIDGIYQQAILQAAQAGYYDEAAKTAMEQAGVLYYDKEYKRFEVNKQNSDRNWRLATSVVQTALQAGGTAAGAMIGVGSLAKAGMIGSTTITPSPWHFTPTGDYNFITY